MLKLSAFSFPADTNWIGTVTVVEPPAEALTTWTAEVSTVKTAFELVMEP